MTAGTSHDSKRAAGNRPAVSKRSPLWPISAGLALLLACCGEPAPPRHLVLITIDTLRRDRVSTYGYHRGTTPNLDRLAAPPSRRRSQEVAVPEDVADRLRALGYVDE